jgi:oligoribonuclease NrnB/cAMP/cGMP phosphodiesterase (DHH superfamily)
MKETIKKSFYRQASVIDIFAKDLKIIFANEREDNPITSLIVLLTLYDELNKFIAKLGLTYFWDDLYSVFIEDETAITTHILEMFKAQVANTKLATHRKLVETHKP